MSLRPRYSLLTLLILTALIAGGVKLWYGPHYVVERIEPFREFEYTYTRDWRGNKVLQGICVCRSIDPDKMKNSGVIFLYYRHGVQLHWHCSTLFIPDDFETAAENLDEVEVMFEAQRINAESVMTPIELAEFHEALERQKSNLPPPAGYKFHLFQDAWDGPSDIEELKERLGSPFSFE